MTVVVPGRSTPTCGAQDLGEYDPEIQGWLQAHSSCQLRLVHSDEEMEPLLGEYKDLPKGAAQPPKDAGRHSRDMVDDLASILVGDEPEEKPIEAHSEPVMKLWRISQEDRSGYDTFDSAVVAAETEEEAKLMHPHDGHDITKDKNESYGTWVNRPQLVTAEYFGVARETTEKGVVTASFNAG